MIKRTAEKLVRSYSKQFRALAIVGPRQSGKTTLAKKVFPKKEYVSLENPDELMLAETDPRAFLARFPKGAILDEAQRVPSLFSYLQHALDETKKGCLYLQEVIIFCCSKAFLKHSQAVLAILICYR